MNSNTPDESRFFRIFFTLVLTFLLCICTFGLLFLSSCNSIPDIVRAADDFFDDAVKVTIDKAALQKDSNLSVSVELKNQE